MNHLTDTIIGAVLGIVIGSALAHIEQAPISIPREEVVSATLPDEAAREDAPEADAPMSDATAEAHDAVEPEAVSFKSVTFNCPTCKGAGTYYGALCPTCDGAAAATLTKDGVTFSEQGWKQPAPTSPFATAVPATASGRSYTCGPNGCPSSYAPSTYQRRRAVLPWRNR